MDKKVLLRGSGPKKKHSVGKSQMFLVAKQIPLQALALNLLQSTQKQTAALENPASSQFSSELSC